MTSNRLEQEQYKYQTLSEIEHVLQRSGTWIGSKFTALKDCMLYKPSVKKIVMMSNINQNDGLIKLADEIISNSIDESRASDALFKVDEISVSVNTSGKIKIRDNGGIAVIQHKQMNMLIPEMLFGHLRTSGNYDDSQERNKVGLNGLGAKLANIFSKKFTVTTADGNNKVTLEWSNNMRDLKHGNVTPSKEHFTEIEFEIDLERFDLQELDLSFCLLLQKRCIDGAAANPQITINYECDVANGVLNSTWYFSNFSEYVKLYISDEMAKHMLYNKHRNDEVIIMPESDVVTLGMVNGALCNKGTHFKKVYDQVTKVILKQCEVEEMELITERDVKNHLSVFINTSIDKPYYDSQTKDELSNKLGRENLYLTEAYLQSILDSVIMSRLRDFYDGKYAKEKQKNLNKLNKLIKGTKSKKYIKPNSSVKTGLELWIFEGDSAGKGFRNKRNTLTQSGYLLRGKIKNTFNLKREQIIENQELRELINIMCLQFEEPKKNIKNCPFEKIVFATDADFDGAHICGLLLAFFAKHFPEIMPKIYRCQAPIVVAIKGKERKYYVNLEDYERDEEELIRQKYNIDYKKGLGSLEDEDYKPMLWNQNLISFDFNKLRDMPMVNVWFSKSTEQRKEIIMDDNSELDAVV